MEDHYARPTLRERMTIEQPADTVTDFDVAKAVLLGKYKNIDAALMDFPWEQVGAVGLQRQYGS